MHLNGIAIWYFTGPYMRGFMRLSSVLDSIKMHLTSVLEPNAEVPENPSM